MTRRLLISLMLSLGLASSLSAAPLGTRTVLDNNATLLVAERPGLPMVVLSMVLKTGAAVDPQDKQGLANLTAALLTRGTKSYSAQALAEELDFLGTSLSVDAGNDATTIGLTTLTKNLDRSFALLAEVILSPRFPQDEFERIRTEIEGRLHSNEEDPGWVAGKAFREHLYPQHPYGQLISGQAETLARITPDDIRQFHATYYRPNNAIIAVAGEITQDQVGSLLASHFADWQAADLPDFSWPDPPEREARQVNLNKEVTQANIMIGHSGIARSHPDYYAVLVMNHILGGGGFGSRLMDRIREEQGYAYSVGSYFSARKHPGPFTVALQTKNESARQAIAETLAVIRHFRQEGAAEEEVEAAKAYLTNSFPLRLISNSDVAGMLPVLEFYGLGLDYPDRYPDIIGSVTLEQVRAAAKQHLHPDQFLQVVVADLEKAGLEQAKTNANASGGNPEPATTEEPNPAATTTE